jgi:hypothetical protein
MAQITNRIDHVAWMCRPENHDAYVEKLSKLFNITFEADDGGPDFGLRITWSWSAGLEVLSPAGDPDAPYAKMGWDFIAHKGEGLFAMVFGVEDVAATMEHARSLGYDPSPLHSLPPTEKAWRKRVQDCTESVLEVWLGENLAIGRIITDEPGRT